MKRISKLSWFAALACSMLVSCAEEAVEGGTPALKPVIRVKLTAPDDVATGVSTLPTFEWDGEIIPDDVTGAVYDVCVGETAATVAAVASDVNSTSYTLTEPLKMGSKYFWQVVGKLDGKTFDSKLYSFTVADFIAPIPTSPAEGDIVLSELKFAWTESTAIDGVSYTYTIMAQTEGGEPFAVGEPVVDAGELDATSDIVKFEDGKSYSWWVVAVTGESEAASSKLSFDKVKPLYPSAPVLTAPKATDSFDKAQTDVTFEWTEAVDPEGDAVTYHIYVNDTEVGTTTDLSYTLDLASYAVGECTWYVDAVDATDHSTKSEPSKFIVTEEDVPDTHVIAPLATPGTYGLKEQIVWGIADGYTYTVSLKEKSASSWTNIETGLEVSMYTIPNKYLDCTIKDVKTYQFKVTAKKSGSADIEYAAIEFKPQMTGTFTDSRTGIADMEYSWVRIGTQVWMSQDLKATHFTDGTPLTKVAPYDAVTPAVPNNNQHYTVLPDDYYDVVCDAPSVPILSDFKTQVPFADFQKMMGNFYPMLTIIDPKLAPEGWHAMTKDDLSTLLFETAGFKNANESNNGSSINDVKKFSVTDKAKTLMSETFGGTDDYGLSLNINAIKNGTDANYYTKGWCDKYWDNHGFYAMVYDEVKESHDYTKNTYAYFFAVGLDTETNRNAKGKWIVEWRTWSYQMMMPVRCVMDE